MNIVQDRTPPGFHRGEDRRKQLLCRGFPDPFRPLLAGLSNGLNRLKHSPKVFFALGGAFEDGIGLIHGVSGRLRLLRQVGVLLAQRRVAGFGLLRPIFFPRVLEGLAIRIDRPPDLHAVNAACRMR